MSEPRPGSDRIVWIDSETTGIDARTDRLLEVACLITDTDLNIIDEQGYHADIFYSERDVRKMKEKTDPYVINMHDTSGLWDRLPQGKPVRQAGQELLDYIRMHAPIARQARLGGNSVALDKDFLRESMPAVLNYLHYRVIDVSTLTALAGWWGEIPPMQKKTAHEAMADIRESIAELAYIRSFMGWKKS